VKVLDRATRAATTPRCRRNRPRSDNDAFHYKSHSPATLIEYDCRQRDFFDNARPEPFNVHTVIRTPSGSD
jgi:hypothetical protein